jgi:hypothetical protein
MFRTDETALVLTAAYLLILAILSGPTWPGLGFMLACLGVCWIGLNSNSRLQQRGK